MNSCETLTKIKCTSPNVNAICSQAPRCYRISCAVSTDALCRITEIGCTTTETRADCLIWPGKGVVRIDPDTLSELAPAQSQVINVKGAPTNFPDSGDVCKRDKIWRNRASLMRTSQTDDERHVMPTKCIIHLLICIVKSTFT